MVMLDRQCGVPAQGCIFETRFRAFTRTRSPNCAIAVREPWCIAARVTGSVRRAKARFGGQNQRMEIPSYLSLSVSDARRYIWLMNGGHQIMSVPHGWVPHVGTSVFLIAPGAERLGRCDGAERESAETRCCLTKAWQEARYEDNARIECVPADPHRQVDT